MACSTKAFNKETFEQRYNRILVDFKKRFKEAMSKIDPKEFSTNYKDLGDLELTELEEKCEEYENSLSQLKEERNGKGIKDLSAEVTGFLDKVDRVKIYEGETEKRDRKSNLVHRLHEIVLEHESKPKKIRRRNRKRLAEVSQASEI